MINALSAKGEEALCGDLSIFLNEVLNASGIKSRIVQLATDKFVKGEADLDTHVTVEAYLDGKWMIVDPTFNATLTCGQGTVFIDAKEAHDCVEAGKELVPHYGETKLPGRLMSQYYVPVPTLYENYAYQVKTDDGNYKTVFQAPRPDWLTLAVERLQKEHVN
jgi:hypothetical protein